MQHSVLFVDDEPNVLKALARLMHGAPLHFLSANNANEALAALEAGPIAVVVCDEHMPGMRGSELLKIVARRWPATVRLMLTGKVDFDVAKRAINEGFVHQFLLKPCDAKTIFGAIKAALQRIELERGAGVTQLAAAILPPEPCAEHEMIEFAASEWRAIVDALEELVCFVDGDGRLVRANKTIERWSVASVKQVAGKRPHELLHPRCQDAKCALGSFIERALKNDLAAFEPMCELQDATLARTLRITCVIPPDQKPGVAPRRLLILHDTTRERALEHETRRLGDQLLQSQKLEAIGRLAAGVAHEINTPSQFVRDNLEFLSSSLATFARAAALHQELLDAVHAGAADETLVTAQTAALANLDLPYLLDEMPKAAAQGIEGIGRIASIVRALKEFSHPGSAERSTFDLAHSLESTITVARNEWKDVAHITTDFAHDLPNVEGFPGELNQVFLNLIVNSAQALRADPRKRAPGSGSIKISARRDGEHVELTFADDGPGIPPSIRHRIFEPFFTTKPVGTGTGQGLALARNVVVRLHGGTIDFESEEGRGTTFILRLPIRGPVEPLPEADAGAGSAPGTLATPSMTSAALGEEPAPAAP